MPRPGIVDADLIAFCRGRIDAEFGPIPDTLSDGHQASADNYRDKLARIVAAAAQYVRDNGGVVVGQTVAPGTFNVPGVGGVEGEGIVDLEGELY